MVFDGNYSLTLDAKGRLSVPKKFRHSLEEQCGPRVVITIDPYEGCLVVYPITEWRHVEKRLEVDEQAGEAGRVKAEWMQRFVIGNAQHCDMDSQGRLLISPELRKRAGLGREDADRDGDRKDEKRQVRAIGMDKKFELWVESVWDRRSKEYLKWNRELVADVMTGPAVPEPESAPAAA